MVWATQPNDDGSRAPRISLADLKMPQAELFARVIEGICPGCARRLNVRPLNDRNQTYAESCGWCELCLWGWSATVWRGGDGHAWKRGEPLVAVYNAGALA